MDLQMSFDNMISTLDEVTAMLMVKPLNSQNVERVMDMVTDVSISLNSWKNKMEDDFK